MDKYDRSHCIERVAAQGSGHSATPSVMTVHAHRQMPHTPQGAKSILNVSVIACSQYIPATIFMVMF